MSFLKKVNRVCKCGHKQNPDHKHQKSIFGFKFDTGNTKCNVKPCCCKKFLDRRFPTKFDTAMMIFSFIGIGFGVIFFGLTMTILSMGLSCHTQVCNQALDKPIYTVREVGSLLQVGMVLFLLWIIASMFPSDYFRDKKRVTEPIPEPKKELLFDGFEISKEKPGEEPNGKT